MKKGAGSATALSRRGVLKCVAALAGSGVGLAACPASLEAQARGGRGARGGGGAQADPETGSTLILIGTQGGPTITQNRAESANALLVNGEPYLIDCGYGTIRGLQQAGIRLGQVANVFVTHLHDDHTADVAALLSHKWTGTASPRPAAVHGPYGTAAMVAGAIAFFRGNVEIRMVDEGRTVKPETVFSGRDLSAPAIAEVFRDERVTVLAAENAHFPERAKAKMPHRSLAYRFNTPDRSFVFSGDTAYSPTLVELASGADVLVCEVMSMAFEERAIANRGSATGESIFRHVAETHSSSEDVGRMAAEARVKTLVLSHLLGAGTEDADPFTADVKTFFKGEVIIGADQMRL